MPDLNDLPRTYSPPPVSADEAEPAFSHPSGGAPWEDVARWRKAERARLIDERMQMSADKRLAGSERIARKLDRAIGKAGNRIVSLYWPFKGEPGSFGW